VKAERLELLEELKGLTKREQEIEEAKQTELEEVKAAYASLQGELRSSKKHQASQLTTLSQQYDAANKQLAKSETDLENVREQLSVASMAVGEKDELIAEQRNLMEEEQTRTIQEAAALRQQVDELNRKGSDSAKEVRQAQESQDALKMEVRRLMSESRELKEGKREAEHNNRELERQVRHANEDRDKANDEAKRLRVAKLELDEKLHSAKHSLQKEESRATVLEKEGFAELKLLRSQVGDLISRAETAEEKAEQSVRDSEKAVQKQSQVESTSAATINGLMAEIRATEETLGAERDRMSHEAEMWKQQVKELESETESAAAKYKNAMAQLREESEKQRRAAYSLQGEVNKSRVAMEGRRREAEALSAELEAARDQVRDGEKKTTGARDGLRVAQREMEALKTERNLAVERQRHYEESQSAEIERLKSEVDRRSTSIAELQEKLHQSESDHAQRVSLLQREKEDLLEELGLGPGKVEGRRGRAGRREAASSVSASPVRSSGRALAAAKLAGHHNPSDDFDAPSEFSGDGSSPAREPRFRRRRVPDIDESSEAAAPVSTVIREDGTAAGHRTGARVPLGAEDKPPAMLVIGPGEPGVPAAPTPASGIVDGIDEEIKRSVVCVGGARYPTSVYCRDTTQSYGCACSSRRSEF